MDGYQQHVSKHNFHPHRAPHRTFPTAYGRGLRPQRHHAEPISASWSSLCISKKLTKEIFVASRCLSSSLLMSSMRERARSARGSASPAAVRAAAAALLMNLYLYLWSLPHPTGQELPHRDDTFCLARLSVLSYHACSNCKDQTTALYKTQI